MSGYKQPYEDLTPSPEFSISKRANAIKLQWEATVRAYNGDEEAAVKVWAQISTEPCPIVPRHTQTLERLAGNLENEYATEQDLTNAIIKELRARGCIAFHSDAGHTTDATSSKRGRPPKGYPDIPVYAPDGRHVLLEVKQPSGKLSQDQADFIKSIRKLEHHVSIVRTVQEAVNAVFGDALEMRGQ